MTDYNWTNNTSDGKAATAGNWNPVDTGPGVSDKMIFSNTDSSDDCDINIAEVTDVDIETTYAGTVTLDNGFTISNDLHIGTSGTFDTGANRALTVTGGVSGSGILVGNTSTLNLGWLTMDGTYDASDNVTNLNARSGPGGQLLMNASDITHNNGIFQFNGAAGGNSYISLYGASDATNGLYDVVINASGRTITNISQDLTIQRHLTLTAGTFQSYPKNLTVVGTINLNGTSELHCSGNTVSANNWDKSSGPGTLHCWGDETVSSNDNMQLKGIYHEDCTATINCPAVMGNGGLQQVSGTATPTFIVGGWSAAMEPAGNSTVILTGSRDFYVENRGHPYEGFFGGFWNLTLSGSADKDIQGGQNSTVRVFNDLKILSGSKLDMADLPSNVTTGYDTYALSVSGNFICSGTYVGEQTGGTAPNQRFGTVFVEGGGASFTATSGITTTDKEDQTYRGNQAACYLTNDATFYNNNGTWFHDDDLFGYNFGGEGWRAQYGEPGKNRLYNLIISGAVNCPFIPSAGRFIDIPPMNWQIENDLTLAQSTQFAPFDDGIIGGNVWVKDSAKYRNYYIASGGNNCNMIISGNLTLDAGTTLDLSAHTNSGDADGNPYPNRYLKIHGNYINKGATIINPVRSWTP